jgi:DNA modification methylase
MNEYLNKIICGDSLEELRKFPSESVDCVITSPPYFNLRDYGVDGQIGLESTWQEYIGKLVAVFDEVKRVLKKEGTCFVNLGDSYSTVSGGMRGGDMGRLVSKRAIQSQRFTQPKIKDMQSKCLMMIPERFAIEMIDRGWILRNKLVWIKRNAMPESVQDRWKKAHEYIFFFVKSKKYYFNLNAIRTPHCQVSLKRAEFEQGRNALGQNPSNLGDKSAKYGMPARVVKLNPSGAVPPDFLDIFTNCSEEDTVEHYATYPQTLISPLMLAGCPDGGIVLDPFFGSGTTGLVAKKQMKNYIGIELNPSYIEIAERRLSQRGLF